MSEIVTKHISLEKDYINRIRPYVERHNGNVSSAIRDIIDNAERSGLPKNTSMIDDHLLDWILGDIDGILIPDNVLDEIVDSRPIHSMKDFEDYINHRFKEFEWGIDISLKYDNNISPFNVSMCIKGHHRKARFVAHILSQLLIKISLERNPLEIQRVNYSGDYINIDMYRSDKKMAMNSLITFFGYMNDTDRKSVV